MTWHCLKAEQQSIIALIILPALTLLLGRPYINPAED